MPKNDPPPKKNTHRALDDENIDRKTTTAETHLSVVRPVDRPNEARRDVERADDDEEGGGCLPRHGEIGDGMEVSMLYVPPCGLGTSCCVRRR